MAMSGMFIPADYGTELSTFDNVFADIGDEQSIEQSLSTFSSHMTNTVRILNGGGRALARAAGRAGRGHRPHRRRGAAHRRFWRASTSGKTLTVATTHYSEIKAFALMHPGMQNASMEFDVDRLCPTYRLFIGIPGKSERV